MNDETFQRAIRDNPADDAVRLVYADWLEEHGDEAARARADVIRTQIEIERLPAGERRKRQALEKKIRPLLKAHAGEWVGPIRDAKFGTEWRFRRGFLGEVTISAREFVRVAKELFDLVPTLYSAHFPDASNEVNALADCPYLARLTEVDLSRMCVCGRCRIDLELRKLFASPHVANLTSLNVARDRIDPDVASALAASPHLSRLTTLDLSGNGLGGAGAKALASAAHLTRLTTLNLARNSIGTVGVRVLAVAPLLENVTTLDLSGNPIGDAGAKALAKSPRLKNIKRLKSAGCGIQEAGAEVLRERFGKRVKL